MRKLALLAACAFTACARSGGDLPSIHYGRDACARCGMILSEERFASAYVGDHGETVAFDDVGEFLAAAAQDSTLAAKSYVHDAQDARWLRASQAVFVKMPGLATPMGSGYAAFSTEGEASGFARRLGLRVEGGVVTLPRSSR